MAGMGPQDFEGFMRDTRRRIGTLERHRHGPSSTVTDGTGSDPDATYVPGAPSAPTLTVRNGVVTLTWDGNGQGGDPLDPRAVTVEVHRSLERDPAEGTVDSPVNEDFKPTPTSRVTNIAAPGPGSVTMGDQQYNTRWYYRLVAVSAAGIKGPPGPAASIMTLSLQDSDIIGEVIDGGHLLDNSIPPEKLIGGGVVGGDVSLKVDKSSVAVNVRDYGATGGADDTAAVVEALADAVADGRDMYWPEGTYTVTANLVGFWTVDHFGPGIISTGGNLYRVVNVAGQTNTIYMTAGGSNANDGLSAARPIATFGQVDLILQRLAYRVLRGSWKIRMSGTFNGGYTFSKNLRPANPIVFEGDPLDVNDQPVTRINYVAGGSIFGLRFEPGGWVQLRYLWFDGFKVSFNGYGALTKGGGDMYVLGCKATNCDTGFAVVDQAVMGLYASFADSCTTGARCQYGSTATIGALNLPTVITNCDLGFMTTRNAVSHFDYSTVADCTVGIEVEMAARMAMIDGTVHRNGVGVLINGTAEWTRDPNTDWGNGTADANGVNVRQHGAGHENRLQAQDTHVEWRTFVSAPGTYATSTGTNTALIACGSAIRFEPYHFVERKEQKLRAKVYGTLSGAGAKAIYLYRTAVDGTGAVPLGSIASLTAAGEFTADIEVWPNNDGTVTYRGTAHIEGSTVVHRRGTATVPVGEVWLFRLYASSGDSSSAVSIELFELFITG